MRRFLRRNGGVGLRRRILLTFTLGSLTLSAFLAVTTYGLVRSNLIEQRYAANRQAAYADANTVLRELSSGPPTLAGASEQLRIQGVQRPVIYYRNTWSAGISRFGYQELPPELVAKVLEQDTPARMITKVGGDTVMVFGIPLPGVGAYFEFFDLGDANQTLSSVALSLFLASVITTLLGVLLGVFAARRAVRPVAEAAQAAKAIAGGHLGTRLPPSDDPDLGVLAGVVQRHGLGAAAAHRARRPLRLRRQPRAALAADDAVGVGRGDGGAAQRDARAGPGRARPAVQRRQPVPGPRRGPPRDQPLRRRRHPPPPRGPPGRPSSCATRSPSARRRRSTVTVSDRAESAVIRGDRRRLARVLANLIDNANAYGGGDPEVTITDANLPDEPLSHVQVGVEDHGPGVPVEERALIFERFARGATAGRRSGSEGAGLGLALVDEHVRIHGGRVWVEDRLDGDAGRPLRHRAAGLGAAAGHRRPGR